MESWIFKMDRTRLLILFFSLFLLQGCSKFDCPIGKTSVDSLSRPLPAFNQISLADKINLVLTYDSIQSVKLVGSGNVLKGIITKIQDSVLQISNGNKCMLLADPAQNVTVYISSHLLNRINYAGAGNISSTNTMQASEFTVQCQEGSGSIDLSLNVEQANAIIIAENADIRFQGQSNAVYAYAVDAGTIDLSNFSSENSTVVNKSVRDMYVNVSGNGTLIADVLYIGNVYYKGNPANIQSVITNSGKLIHLQ